MVGAPEGTLVNEFLKALAEKKTDIALTGFHKALAGGAEPGGAAAAAPGPSRKVGGRAGKRRSSTSSAPGVGDEGGRRPLLMR